jgi:hypothetical protein
MTLDALSMPAAPAAPSGLYRASGVHVSFESKG